MFPGGEESPSPINGGQKIRTWPKDASTNTPEAELLFYPNLKCQRLKVPEENLNIFFPAYGKLWEAPLIIRQQREGTQIIPVYFDPRTFGYQGVSAAQDRMIIAYDGYLHEGHMDKTDLNQQKEAVIKKALALSEKLGLNPPHEPIGYPEMREQIKLLLDPSQAMPLNKLPTDKPWEPESDSPFLAVTTLQTMTIKEADNLSLTRGEITVMKVEKVVPVNTINGSGEINAHRFQRLVEPISRSGIKREPDMAFVLNFRDTQLPHVFEIRKITDRNLDFLRIVREEDKSYQTFIHGLPSEKGQELFESLFKIIATPKEITSVPLKALLLK